MEWPAIYQFPPFFTLQPHEETRAKQLTAWCGLVKDYCHRQNVFEIVVADAANTDLFNNKEIKRKAPVELIKEVMSALEATGNAEPVDADKTTYRIYWRSVEEWAQIIYNYIKDNSMFDMVLTLYELHSGDDTQGQEFHEMDMATFRKALEALEYQGRCTVFKGDTTDDDGVKFYNA